MAINIPASAREQVDRNLNLDNGERTSYTRVFKGTSYADLATAAKLMEKGDTFDDASSGDNKLRLKSFSLQRVNGGGGKLTLTFDKNDTTGSGSGAVTTCLKEVWSLKAVRNDVSILNYCGPTPGTHPSRVFIENWQRETSITRADNNDYEDSQGNVHHAGEETGYVLNKIRAGKESVIRFYPILTRKRTYSSFPDGCLDDLATINTPPTPGNKAKKPTGLAEKVAQYSWLKIQDDVDEQQSDGHWLRTESWMGIPTAYGSWDANLYGTGTARWPMPLTRQAGSDSGADCSPPGYSAEVQT